MQKKRFLQVAQFTASREALAIALQAMQDQAIAAEQMASGGSLRTQEYGRSSLHEAQALMHQYSDVCAVIVRTAQGLRLSVAELTVDIICEAGYVDIQREACA